MARSMLTAVVLIASASAQTNTLLILGDDMGVDTIGAYKEGASPAPTPNLDRLAVNGVLFRNAYTSPACTPSRANLMTGRHGFRTGVGKAFDVLPLAEVTLPEILPTSHAHALIGKWHMGGFRAASDHPNRTGWKHFSGHLGGFFISPETFYSWNKVVDSRSSRSTVYATSDNVNDAIAWIKARTGAWVLSLNFNAPHSPFHAPPAGLHSQNLSGKNPRQHPVAFFKAMVEAMDTEIGRLLAGIDARTLARTNIIFLGDNGTDARVSEPPFTGAHAKFTLYEGGTNVPLIVSGPAVRSPGREVSALVHSVDLFPTIAEFAGVDAHKAVGNRLDGVSIVPYLRNPQQRSLREFVYTETFGGRATYDGVAVRNERYKLLRPARSSDELYDLVADPFEKRNLLRGTLTREQRENRDRLVSELARLKDEAAWFVFGLGCAGKGKVPTLSAAAGQRPLLGQVFATETGSLEPGVQLCLGMLGFSRRRFGALPLPFDLGVLRAPGCKLYVSMDVLQALTVASRKATWNLPLPASSGLLGLRFYQQSMVFEPGANPIGLILTNAGEGCIGNQ